MGTVAKVMTELKKKGNVERIKTSSITVRLPKKCLASA